MVEWANEITKRCWAYPKVVEALKGRFESARASALPRSALGKACDYSLGRWGQLRRFLDYGEIELSNNVAENAIRSVVEMLDGNARPTRRFALRQMLDMVGEVAL